MLKKILALGVSFFCFFGSFSFENGTYGLLSVSHAYDGLQPEKTSSMFHNKEEREEDEWFYCYVHEETSWLFFKDYEVIVQAHIWGGVAVVGSFVHSSFKTREEAEATLRVLKQQLGQCDLEDKIHPDVEILRIH